MVLITAVIALVFGHESAQGAIISEAGQFIGERGAETVKTLLENAQKPASGAIASVVAFVTLLFGASGVFTELQAALNLIWDVQEPAAAGFLGLIKQRLFSFGMVLSVGFLLLVSLLLSAGLAFIGHSFGQLVPVSPVILQAINFGISFVVVTGLFALMFRYVPAARVAWKDVIVGAVGTALLFTIGKLLLGLYLGKASVGSTYGAAGSLVAVVVWIYYSAQIFFFGAEFTHLYSERHSGKNVSPAEEHKPEPSSSTSLEPPSSARDERMPTEVSAPMRTVAQETNPRIEAPALPTTKAGRTDRAHRPLAGVVLMIGFGFLVGRASWRPAGGGIGRGEHNPSSRNA